MLKKLFVVGICLSLHTFNVAVADDGRAGEILKSEIPIQVDITDNEKYPVYRDLAASFLESAYSNECARFVNRLFFVRFGKLMFGNAWDLQLKKSNQKFLKLVWQLPEKVFSRVDGLRLKNYTDRINHFRELYAVLNREEHPLGVIGFVYRYSFYRDIAASIHNALPQTHVVFLAGKKNFFFENDSEVVKDLETILTEKYGKIHDFERVFVSEKVPLKLVLAPGAKFYYQDYLVEEQFKQIRSGSLLELFLRKHRNNRVVSLLRPVSFSRISDELIAEIKTQKYLLNTLGNTEIVRGSEFEDHFTSEQDRERWAGILEKRFGIRRPDRVLWVPVPGGREEVVSTK